MATMSNLTFDPPAEFLEEELTTAWRTPKKAQLKEPRMLQAQLPVRPNLIVNRRRVAAGTDIAQLAAETCTQLLETIPGISGIETHALSFKDGVEGVLLELSFPTAGYTVVQLHAMRVDGDVLTSMVISTEKSRLSPDELRRFKSSLASAAVTS
ncbi:MAG: hypothetical protein IT384_09315 [Deltaproteobacteria bacterium]|nr:hypothetical protein [Deltaproteobacteria bacterium]